MRKTGSECLINLPKVTQQECGTLCLRAELVLFHLFIYCYYFPRQHIFFYQHRCVWSQWEGAKQECKDAGVGTGASPCSMLRPPTSCLPDSVWVGRVQTLDLGCTSCSQSALSQPHSDILYSLHVVLYSPFHGHERWALLNSLPLSLLNLDIVLNQLPSSLISGQVISPL